MSELENHYAHAPLPYVVVLRVALTDDGKTERFERSVTAYSAYEAVHAAVIEAAGVLDFAKVKIESIRPDDAAYWALTIERLAQVAAKDKQ